MKNLHEHKKSLIGLGIVFVIIIIAVVLIITITGNDNASQESDAENISSNVNSSSESQDEAVNGDTSSAEPYYAVASYDEMVEDVSTDLNIRFMDISRYEEDFDFKYLIFNSAISNGTHFGYGIGGGLKSEEMLKSKTAPVIVYMDVIAGNLDFEKDSNYQNPPVTPNLKYKNIPMEYTYSDVSSLNNASGTITSPYTRIGDLLFEMSCGFDYEGCSYYITSNVVYSDDKYSGEAHKEKIPAEEIPKEILEKVESEFFSLIDSIIEQEKTSN